MLTIRERIIQLIHSQLETITLANGYNTNIGTRVFRGRNNASPEEIPCTFLFSFGDDNSTKNYNETMYEFDIGVISLIRYKTHNASSESEKILGDHISCLASQRFSMPFTGGYREPGVGQYLTGSTSNATALLEEVVLSSGSWAAHNAVGTFNFRLLSGTFILENLLNTGSELVATTTGHLARIPRLNSLVNEIDYKDSVVTNYPEPGEDVVKVTSTFLVTYATLTGNPYKQGE